MTTIKLCLPYYYVIHPLTKKSIDDCLNYSGNDIKFKFEMAHSSLVTSARNALVSKNLYRRELEDDIDFYLCLDSDIIFNIHDVKNILHSGKKVIGGAYTKHSDKSIYNACKWHEIRGQGWNGEFLNTSHTGLKKVDWCGTGFLLIHRSVFLDEKVLYPFFRLYEVSYRKDNWIVQDDVGFCINVKNAGYEIYCDCNVKIKHLDMNKYYNSLINKGEKMEDIKTNNDDLMKVDSFLLNAQTGINKIVSDYYSNIMILKNVIINLRKEIAEKDQIIETLGNNDSKESTKK